jgi:hypothetical protein
VREHEDHVALYYALRRNGDGQFNPATGKNDGISSVYRIRLSSAYVVDPDKPMDIPILAGDDQGQHYPGRGDPRAAAGTAGHRRKAKKPMPEVSNAVPTKVVTAQKP